MEKLPLHKKEAIQNIDFDAEKWVDFNKWAKNSFASQIGSISLLSTKSKKNLLRLSVIDH
jgi:hypothetical protein